MRCWRADSATDVELAVTLGHGRPPERQHPGEHAVTKVQAGYLGEDPLRSPDHPAGPDVVGRAVPGANQAAVLVDAAARQVSAKVPTSARDREVAPARVPDGIAASAGHRARREIGRCGNPLWCAHRALLPRTLPVYLDPSPELAVMTGRQHLLGETNCPPTDARSQQRLS